MPNGKILTAHQTHPPDLATLDALKPEGLQPANEQPATGQVKATQILEACQSGRGSVKLCGEFWKQVVKIVFFPGHAAGPTGGGWALFRWWAGHLPTSAGFVDLTRHVQEQFKVRFTIMKVQSEVGEVVGLCQGALEGVPALSNEPRVEGVKGVVRAAAPDHESCAPQAPGVAFGQSVLQVQAEGCNLRWAERSELTGDDRHEGRDMARAVVACRVDEVPELVFGHLGERHRSIVDAREGKEVTCAGRQHSEGFCQVRCPAGRRSAGVA